MLTVSTAIAPGEDLQVFANLLTSINFADEILIYNFGRRDAKLARLIKAGRGRVINLQPPYPKIVEGIRTRQIKEAKHDWVLVMDFDEIVTPSLKDEILQVTGSSSPHAAYAIRRRNFSLGYPLRHGGFGDDYVFRLFRRTKFVRWPAEIHSTPDFQGSFGKLTNVMEHHKDATLCQMVTKTNRYSEVEARLFFDGGLPPVTPLTLIRKTGMEFIRRYFLKFGFLDGKIGLIQSLYQAFSVFITYSKLYELQKESHA